MEMTTVIVPTSQYEVCTLQWHMPWGNINIDRKTNICNNYIEESTAHQSPTHYSPSIFQQWQQVNRGSPEVLLSSHLFQLFLGKPEAFQDRVGYISPPTYSGSEMQIYYSVHSPLWVLQHILSETEWVTSHNPGGARCPMHLTYQRIHRYSSHLGYI